MKIIICGAGGRMGKELIIAASTNQAFALVAGIVRNKELVGKDLGEISNCKNLNVLAYDRLETVIDKCDAVVDFSSPESSMQFAKIASEHHKIYVSGVTGYNNEQLNTLKKFGEEITIFYSANTSYGVNILMKLAALAAKYMPHYDIDLVDIHHKHKKDSPSGTAKMIISSVNNVLPEKEVMFSSIRTGDYFGEHSLRFSEGFESITITHHAHARSIFANGALKACIWASGQPKGFYTMDDMLR